LYQGTPQCRCSLGAILGLCLSSVEEKNERSHLLSKQVYRSEQCRVKRSIIIRNLHYVPLLELHLSTMKNPVTILCLLVSFAVSGIAEDCDPNAPYFVQPYDGETTKDPAMTKQLIEYWSENTCYKKSDDSEPSMTIQCKNVCFPSADDDKGGAVLSSSTCNFGSSPWSDARTGNPLLCGADKNFAGTRYRLGSHIVTSAQN
jgi:hypothetical protein